MITTLDKLSVPIHQLTQNLTFNIRFHLYIHDHDFEQTFGALTYEVKTYVPPIRANYYIWWFSVTFFWLKWIPINQLTQNLSFNIRFHLYIHDHDFGQTFGTLMRWRHKYPWYWQNATFDGFQLRFFFGFKRIPIHQLTQNLSFNIHFHLYIYDHDFEQTFGTFT